MKVVCSKCGKKKPHTQKYFRPAKGCIRGLCSTCRVCMSQYRREWFAKNRERYLAHRRQLYQKSERVVEARRAKERWKQDPVRQRGLMMQRSIVQRAKKLGLPLGKELRTSSWIIEQLRQTPNCLCCGRKFDLSGSISRGNHGPCDSSPSWDRVNPKVGYVAHNLVLLCWRCNNLKRDASSEELQVVVDWMRSMGV